MAKIERWILDSCGYIIRDNSGKNNYRTCILDFSLIILYSIVSLYNVVKVFFPSALLTILGISSGSFPSVAVIFLNIIALVRININISIRYKDDVRKYMDEIRDENRIITEFDMELIVWDRRKDILRYGYCVDIVIILFVLVFGSTLNASLTAIVVITLVETFISNVIDNLAIRYDAITHVYEKKR